MPPSRIPKSPADRIKNDHRDVISLARLLRDGEVPPVWLPELTHEAMRDLIRARAAAKRDSRVARQRILSMLLRTDKRYAGKHWTGKHRTWLVNQSFGLLSQQIAFNIIVRIWSRLKIAYFNSIRKYLACYLSDLCAIWSASCRLLKVLVS